MNTNKFLKLIVLLVISLQFYQLKAQKAKTEKNGPSTDIAKFLDDGLGGKRYNLIRMRLGRAISGYPGLSYERRFTKTFGVEVGGYYKLFNSLNIDLVGDWTPKTAINLIAFPKFYMTGKSMNKGYYWGPCYRFISGKIDNELNYYINKGSLTGHCLTMNVGSHRQIGKYITYGADLGFGVYYFKYKITQTDILSNQLINSNTTPSDINTFATFDVNIGLLF